MSYLDHIALTTGQCARSLRSEVWPDMQARVRSWLRDALASGRKLYPLPGDFADYSATVLASEGALLVTVWGRAPQVGHPLPLVSFGVAVDESHAGKMWQMMISPQAGAVAPGLKQPSAPYLAVHIHPSSLADQAALAWLPDFERCVAWAWIPEVLDGPDLRVV